MISVGVEALREDAWVNKLLNKYKRKVPSALVI